MKVVLLFEEGRSQIVLTPETAGEKAALLLLGNGNRTISVLRGSYYRCQGGWTRQGSEETSTMLVLDDVEVPA